jgi:hypothetical protein
LRCWQGECKYQYFSKFIFSYPPFYDENPFGIYQKVLAGKIDFPRHFDVKAKANYTRNGWRRYALYSERVEKI